MSILSRKEFHDEQAAYDYVEARVWPHGATCPKCGERDRVSKMGGKSTRIGAYKCYKCRKPFTVKVGTIFESSHVPMHIWLQAIYLMCASKKGISSNQLHRTLGVTLKTAWFMSHRIREAMRTEGGAFGVGGGSVEIDETFIGKEPGVTKTKTARGGAHKMKVLTLVDRDTRTAKSVVIDDLRVDTMAKAVAENMSREARMITDEYRQYKHMAKDVAAQHEFVRHSAGEYVRQDDPEIHTNTVEGFYSVFKRGMKGVYQHCQKQHLHRYAAEFDFRYNNRAAKEISDTVRADIALTGIVGKRLTYQTIGA
ncbi:IS1595 family transposase [Dinoroseobacter sp. S124A]|uniref:IS1595 family transposase n=1 Tax=Dinoroseobacter sp. S124A TaxID=3415128 RepID=UPI003C7E5E45